jgi:WD40 repeat protein
LFAVDAAGQLTLDGEFTNHDAAVTAITYSPNGARMVTAGEDRYVSKAVS